MIPNRKAEIMLEKAENISRFWAYDLSYSKDADLPLLDNVQFIYELSLAELELRALGADYEVTNGLREFKLNNKSSELNERIIKKSSYFKSVGKKISSVVNRRPKNTLHFNTAGILQTVFSRNTVMFRIALSSSDF